mmetsp:Transcript_40921/g.104673  ORF Transcript_40921/g.104673 Transcript_40921/m.104673 type:complete len:206 (+) Transcript_40921:116-733(+)
MNSRHIACFPLADILTRRSETGAAARTSKPAAPPCPPPSGSQACAAPPPGALPPRRAWGPCLAPHPPPSPGSWPGPRRPWASAAGMPHTLRPVGGAARRGRLPPLQADPPQSPGRPACCSGPQGCLRPDDRAWDPLGTGRRPRGSALWPVRNRPGCGSSHPASRRQRPGGCWSPGSGLLAACWHSVAAWSTLPYYCHLLGIASPD